MAVDTDEAESRAETVMQLELADLTEEALSQLGDGESLSAFCRRLRQGWNAEPTAVAARATAVYRWLSTPGRKCGLFDENDYFIGELALLAAGAYRLLGECDNAERWLQRAEGGFRHTVNPGPMLAEIAYMRLALAYDRRLYEDVLDLLPSTADSFDRLGMRREVAKTHFLRAMTLKECARRAEAFDAFRELESSLTESHIDPALLGRTCVELGAFQAADGCLKPAAESYRRAISLLANSGNPAALAHLRMTLGETLRNEGQFDEAATAFREGVGVYAALAMANSVAYGRVVLAETLLLLDRPREAEWEILQALPTIEEQKMVPEGFAAVALLRESVKRRKTDPNALRELREHLQKQN